MGASKSDRLDSHPNFKLPTPNENEGLVAFTLRCAAHLVSPPKEDGESHENECIEVARQILDLRDRVQSAWDAKH